MPTTLTARTSTPRDRQLVYALLGLMCLEVAVGVASARTTGTQTSMPASASASPVTCTVAEVPCHLLGP